MSRSSGLTPVPANFFAFAFGLAGLAEAWVLMAVFGRVSSHVADALSALSALAWLLVLVAYLRRVVTDLATVSRDLANPVTAPFLSLAFITPMLLSVLGLYSYAPGLARTLFYVFLGLTVLLGSWLTGQWMYGPLEADNFHPGYFLPTVAGGLIGSDAAAVIGERGLAEVLFGYGALSWLFIGSIVLGRLLLRPLPPGPLLPTFALLIAPPAVATLAWFDLHGGQIDTVIRMLGGFGLLMILAQIRLLPAYLKLPFMPSTWSFAFSWSAVAAAGIQWLQVARPAGYQPEQYVVIAASSILVGAIAIRTALAACRGQLLPSQPATLDARGLAG
ncbi:MAG: transporter [Frankiales bacterium]|nr:transporter [Frankiales bacterium]